MLLRALTLALFTLPLAVTTLSARGPVNAVATTEPAVALTFDDGPHAANTPRLLELFAREDIRVTFFEVGDTVAKHPGLARAVAEAGHEIGNHSKTHPHLGKMNDLDAVRAELVETQRIIEQAAGVTPRVFRAPFISHGPALWTVLDELKLPSVASRLHVGDWEGKITTEEIIERASRAEAGDIILLHTWQNKTVEALPELIRRLRAKGLRFATVSELLALAPPPAPAPTSAP